MPGDEVRLFLLSLVSLTKLRHIIFILTNNFCFLNKLIYAAMSIHFIAVVPLSHDI